MKATLLVVSILSVHRNITESSTPCAARVCLRLLRISASDGRSLRIPYVPFYRLLSSQAEAPKLDDSLRNSTVG